MAVTGVGLVFVVSNVVIAVTSFCSTHVHRLVIASVAVMVMIQVRMSSSPVGGRRHRIVSVVSQFRLGGEFPRQDQARQAHGVIRSCDTRYTR